METVIFVTLFNVKSHISRARGFEILLISAYVPRTPSWSVSCSVSCVFRCPFRPTFGAKRSSWIDCGGIGKMMQKKDGSNSKEVLKGGMYNKLY